MLLLVGDNLILNLVETWRMLLPNQTDNNATSAMFGAKTLFTLLFLTLLLKSCHSRS